MDVVSGLIHGFGVALQPMNLLWCFVGVVLGTVIGVMPGLGPPATIAMLLPLTFYIVAVMYRRPLVVSVVVAACTAAGFYLVFQVALDVKLPPWTLFRA